MSQCNLLLAYAYIFGPQRKRASKLRHHITMSVLWE